MERRGVTGDGETPSTRMGLNLPPARGRGLRSPRLGMMVSGGFHLVTVMLTVGARVTSKRVEPKGVTGFGLTDRGSPKRNPRGGEPGATHLADFRFTILR